jgi:uncharacterized membrane protein YcfT
VADDAVAERVEAVPVVSRARVAWPDAAKAVCILLVVLGHVTYLHVGEARWFAQAGSPPLWNAVDVVLRPVRMPLFFAVSGFFAAAALTRPWSASLRTRVGQNLYLHGLWMLLGFVVATAVGLPTFMAPERAADLPLAALTASTGLWYLYALAVHFVVARATRSWPAWVPLTLAAGLAVVSFSGVLPLTGDTHGVLENLVWFLAGARLPGAVARIARRPRPVLLGVVLMVLVTVLGAIRLLDPPPVLAAVLELPTRAGAVLLGILVAVALTRALPRACAPLLRLGRRTLPVYAVHGIVLVLAQRPLAAVTEPVFGALPHTAQLLVLLVYPVVLTLAIAWLCLAVQTAAQRIGASWLFALPTRRRSVGARA